MGQIRRLSRNNRQNHMRTVLACTQTLKQVSTQGATLGIQVSFQH